MTLQPKLKSKLVAWVLVGIVLGSVSLSLRWVFLVPIFQSPDEDVHFDYALCLNELHRLIRASSTGVGEVPNWTIHPYVEHLSNVTDKCEVTFHPDRPMPTGYGTKDFYKIVDRTAPPVTRDRCKTRAPALAAVYPYGYYLLLAGWLDIVRLVVRDRPVAIFFGARIFSVLLLLGNLLLCYGVAREMRLRRSFALLLTACIGFFPLTSFVSSYVQPDNLAWTLVTLSYFLSFRLKRDPNNKTIQTILGLALGFLLVTKLQFFVCVALPVFAMVAVERIRPNWQGWHDSARVALRLLLPSLLFELIHVWVVSGTRSCYTGAAPYTNFNQFVIGGFSNAIWDYFVLNTHLSFWAIFGWMDTHIQFRNGLWTQRVMFVLQVCAWIFLALTLVRLEQVASRLTRVARKGRKLLALRMALSNVPLNSYFFFTVFMIALYVYYQNRFGAQGRNWIPFLLPIFFTSAFYAPKALTMQVARRLCCWGVLLGLLTYCAIGGYYSIKTLKNRYYAPRAPSIAKLASQTQRVAERSE